MIAEQLTAQGFNEILNNSLTKGAYYTDLTSFPAANSVKIINALSSDLSVMRQTLLFGGLENINRNVNRRNADLKFYEFGNCYYYNAENKKEGETLAAYSEDLHLGMWLTGNKFGQSWTTPDQKSSIYELKAYIENIFRRLGFNLRKLVTGEYSDDLLSEALTVYSGRGNKLRIETFVGDKTDGGFGEVQRNAVLLQRFLYQSNLQAHNFFNLRFVKRRKHNQFVDAVQELGTNGLLQQFEHLITGTIHHFVVIAGIHLLKILANER
jgi:hypothetical protein